MVLAASGCGGFTAGGRISGAPGAQECIFYAYDGIGMLSMWQMNAGFTCALADIVLRPGHPCGRRDS